MTDVLSVLYSLPFIGGALFGAILMKLYLRAQCKHLDKIAPLPNGQHHHVPSVSRTWLGGLITAAVIGYVLLQVGETEQRYTSLAQQVGDCQADLIRSIERGREIAKENDDLSVRQRELFAELEEAQGIWLTRLIAPDDPEIAKLDTDDPRRQAWGIEVSIDYNQRAAKLRAEVADITKQQRDLAQQREANQLPDPRCAHP